MSRIPRSLVHPQTFIRTKVNTAPGVHTHTHTAPWGPHPASALLPAAVLSKYFRHDSFTVAASQQEGIPTVLTYQGPGQDGRTGEGAGGT